MILGNDALVAARPSTPAQLANACTAAGFDLIVPPSWGDELVAMAYLEQLAGRTERVMVGCACPRVGALLAGRTGVAPRLALAAPPVAAARALRAVHGDAILITYIGDCPSATDPSIDVRFTPLALFAQLERQGVAVHDQSAELPSGQVDRWRRYASVAGGLPALRFLARAPVGRVLRTVDQGAFEREEIPPSRSNILLDLADAAHCACGGTRDRIEECEPARSRVPIVQCPLGLNMGAEPSRPRTRGVTHRGPERSTPRENEVVAPHRDGGDPAHTAAPAMAESASERALVMELPAPVPPTAAMNAPPGVAGDIAGPPSDVLPGASSNPLGASRPLRAVQRARPAAAPPSHRRRLTRRSVVAAAPAIVLAIAAALGIAVYVGGVSLTRRADPVSSGANAVARPSAGDEAARTRPGPSPANRGAPPGPVARVPGATVYDTAPTRGGASRTDSAAAYAARADSVARRDSAARASARRRARREAARVVPGWMPQGRARFVPIDTSGTSGRRPDSSSTGARRDSAGRPA